MPVAKHSPQDVSPLDGHQTMMSEELEEILREVMLVLYEHSQEEGDNTYRDLADELSVIIIKKRGSDG